MSGPQQARPDDECWHIRNLAVRPGSPIIKIPRRRWLRLWLRITGWTLYDDNETPIPPIRWRP